MAARNFLGNSVSLRRQVFNEIGKGLAEDSFKKILKGESIFTENKSIDRIMDIKQQKIVLQPKIRQKVKILSTDPIFLSKSTSQQNTVFKKMAINARFKGEIDSMFKSNVEFFIIYENFIPKEQLDIQKILDEMNNGEITPEEAITKLKSLPNQRKLKEEIRTIEIISKVIEDSHDHIISEKIDLTDLIYPELIHDEIPKSEEQPFLEFSSIILVIAFIIIILLIVMRLWNIF